MTGPGSWPPVVGRLRNAVNRVIRPSVSMLGTRFEHPTFASIIGQQHGGSSRKSAEVSANEVGPQSQMDSVSPIDG